MRNRSVIALLAMSLTYTCTALFHQTVDGQTSAENTLLTIEIMLPRITGDPVEAQRWGKVFQTLGETARIRQPLPSDKPEVRETNRGPIRIIKVIGELDSKGILKFPGHSFSKNETAKLKSWLNELKVYGAQGAPEGKKFWGLNNEQFDQVVKGLATPIENATKGKTVLEVLQSLPIEKTLPVVIHADSRKEFAEVESVAVTQELQGLSSGTVLAVVLRSHGFGFFPLRTPAGTLELTIKKSGPQMEVWPIGWDIDQKTPRNQIVPNLFKFVKTGFEEAPLIRVLDAISGQTRTPILVDEFLCRQKKIDIETASVSYPEKQTAWSLVLGSVVRQARLTEKIRLDEAGKPFIWVAPFVPYIQKVK